MTDRRIKMPRGWRDDIDFMLEYEDFGPGEIFGLQAVRGGEHIALGRVRWFIKLAILWFPDAADYRKLLESLG